MKTEYYVLNNEDEIHCLWIINAQSCQTLGKSGTKLAPSCSTAEDIRTSEITRKITKREARSLFPNLPR